jgi:hypothetical protein
LAGGGADVALGEPVSLQHSVDRCHQHVVPDVELSSLVEQWLLHVLLDDEGAQRPVTILFLALQSQLDVLYAVTHRYAVTAIAVLAWLHDPHVLDVLSPLFGLLELCVFMKKDLELGVIEPLGDMEGKGQCLKDIHLL